MPINPIELDPPLTCVMELAHLPAGVRLLESGSVTEVAEVVRREGFRWVWVEGFPLAGKTSFGLKLAKLLGWRLVDTDSLLGESTPDDTYAGGIDREALHRSLGTVDLRQNVVVSGLCLREVVALLGPIEPALGVYIARVSNPTPASVIWHDGCDLEEGIADPNWMIKDAKRYHATAHPYRDARFVFLRIDNEHVPVS